MGTGQAAPRVSGALGGTQALGTWLKSGSPGTASCGLLPSVISGVWGLQTLRSKTASAEAGGAAAVGSAGRLPLGCLSP